MKKNTDNGIFTFLEKKQCFGNSRIDIFKKDGSSALLTDFALLQCGDCYENGDKSNTYDYWTKTSKGKKEGYSVLNYYTDTVNNYTDCSVGIRPVLPLSYIKSSDYKKNYVNNNGMKFVFFGEYPQEAVDQNMQNILEFEFNNKNLKKTGNKFTIDAKSDGSNKFVPKKLEEYEYDGKRYVRVSASKLKHSIEYNLANDRVCDANDNIWIMVLPIKWKIDETANIAVSDKILFGGIQYKYFNKEKPKKNNTDFQFDFKNYKGEGEFDNFTAIEFMNNFFGREIFQTYQPKIDKNDQISGNYNNPNYYNNNLDSVMVRKLTKK